MASKTIKITEDVYQLLKKLKKKNESFSDLLRRLANQANGKKLEAFFGAWDIEDKEYDNIKKKIERNLIPFNAKKRKFD